MHFATRETLIKTRYLVTHFAETVRGEWLHLTGQFPAREKECRKCLKT